jgi:hypothetical protein
MMNVEGGDGGTALPSPLSFDIPDSIFDICEESKVGSFE